MDVNFENKGELVSYGESDKFIEIMRGVDHWKWQAESPMKIRFMPSFTRDVNQDGFILNISSEQAHRLVKFDINTDAFSIKVKPKIWPP